MHKWPIKLALFLGLLIVLTALGLIRWSNSDFDRPFEEDEWLTVSNYTWAETTPSGERNDLSRIEDYRALPRPTSFQLVLGLYCAAGRWPEPNNHIVHSLLVNASQLSSTSERAARLPALIGGLVFVGGLFWLLGPILRWWYAAVLPFLLWQWPYLIHYSQTARGYTWSLALCVMWLIAIYASIEHPRSIWRGALCVVLGILTFMNQVNLALDWLAPAYFVLVVFRFRPFAQNQDQDAGSLEAVHAHDRKWRANAIIQILVIVTVGLTFLVAHLPSVYSSSTQYGETFASAAGFLALLRETFDYLLPGIVGKALILVAIAGTVMMARSPRDRLIALICMSVFLVSLIHFFLTKRFPYARAAGYLLIPFFLGVSYGVEYCLRSLSVRIRVALWLTGVSALGLAGFFTAPSIRDAAYDQFLARRNELASPEDTWTISLLGAHVDAAIDIYRPKSWDSPPMLDTGHRARVYLHLRSSPDGVQAINATRGGKATTWLPSHSGFELTEGEYNLICLKGSTLNLKNVSPEKSLVMWYPDPERIGLNAKRQLDLADASGVRYLHQPRRYRAKMDVFSRLHCLVFIADSKEEFMAASRVVEEGLRTLGGTAVVFVY